MIGKGIGYAWLKVQVIAWLVLARPEPAERCLTRILARWPDDAYALASRAHLRAQRNDFAAALIDSTRLVERHPARSAADWFNHGFMLEHRGDMTGADAAFRRAVALDPKLDRAWYGLGLALIRQRRFDEAVEALERNTKLQPMSPYGWYQLARVHMDRRDPEQARRIISHLKNFEPKVAAQLERETGLTG
jgi:tetratricopeptide (TPR) repeat protein